MEAEDLRAELDRLIDEVEADAYLEPDTRPNFFWKLARVIAAAKRRGIVLPPVQEAYRLSRQAALDALRRWREEIPTA